MVELIKKELSNRQKKILLSEAAKRDTNKYANQTGFRMIERIYKQRVPEPDFETVLDFFDLDKSPKQLKDKVVEIKLKMGGLGLVKDEEEDKEVKAFTIKDLPGFIYIPNPFSETQQREMITTILTKYTSPPFVSNLDTHYHIPKLGLYPLYYQQYHNTITTEHDDYYTKLKLDPNKVKQGKMESESIVTSKATEGYNYNGKNDKNEFIKNTHLQELNPIEMFKRMRWITFGYQYHWPTKQYLWDDNTPVPSFLSSLCKTIVKSINNLKFSIKDKEDWLYNYDSTLYNPEGGVFNFYQLKDSLMGHIDKSEPNTEAPLVSFSFGNDAVFLMGGKDKEQIPLPVRLRSGDIMIMCGPCRHSYHGVPRIIENTLPTFLYPSESNPSIPKHQIDSWDPIANYLSTTRINANVRQVLQPTEN